MTTGEWILHAEPLLHTYRYIRRQRATTHSEFCFGVEWLCFYKPESHFTSVFWTGIMAQQRCSPMTWESLVLFCFCFTIGSSSSSTCLFKKEQLPVPLGCTVCGITVSDAQLPYSHSWHPLSPVAKRLRSCLSRQCSWPCSAPSRRSGTCKHFQWAKSAWYSGQSTLMLSWNFSLDTCPSSPKLPSETGDEPASTAPGGHRSSLSIAVSHTRTVHLCGLHPKLQKLQAAPKASREGSLDPECCLLMGLSVDWAVDWVTPNTFARFYNLCVEPVSSCVLGNR